MKRQYHSFISAIALVTLPFLAAMSPMDRVDAGEETTYSVCYFREKNNPASENWQWGLSPNNGWFSMSGQWAKQRHTGATYFTSITSAQSIIDSCQKSRQYYGYDTATYDLVGIYAANSSLGNNYEIRVNDVAVKP